jgi:hypothetical protein
MPIVIAQEKNGFWQPLIQGGCHSNTEKWTKYGQIILAGKEGLAWRAEIECARNQNAIAKRGRAGERFSF